MNPSPGAGAGSVLHLCLLRPQDSWLCTWSLSLHLGVWQTACLLTTTGHAYHGARCQSLMTAGQVDSLPSFLQMKKCRSERLGDSLTRLIQANLNPEGPALNPCPRLSQATIGVTLLPRTRCRVHELCEVGCPPPVTLAVCVMFTAVAVRMGVLPEGSSMPLCSTFWVCHCELQDRVLWRSLRCRMLGPQAVSTDRGES